MVDLSKFVEVSLNEQEDFLKVRETLEIFNKKALYIYIREITDVSTPQITKIIKKLKVIYVQLYNEYYQHGYIKI